MISDEQYLKIADEAFNEALEIVRSTDGWKVEKEEKENNVIVEMKKNSKGRKIYRCKATVNMPAKLLREKIADTDNICSWNKTLTSSKILKKINDNVGISYQMTTAAAGGMVSARDFVYLFKVGYEGESWVMGGRSVEYSEAPSNSGIVRAINGPGLQMVTPLSEDTCEIVWLMDCEYRGMMLQKIVDVAMPMAQTSYVECVRELAANLKKEGKF